MKKTALLTCFAFLTYTGSELNTLTQADYLNGNGYDVDIFALEIGDPLASSCPEGIRLIDYYHSNLLRREYDLIISRQWPVLDYLIFAENIYAKRIYFECVSWKLPIDFYPYFYKDITMVGYVSERVKGVLDGLGYDTSSAYYFPNYADDSFFESGEDKLAELSSKTSPKNIAIISNHAPSELEAFARIANEDLQINVDMIGLGHEQRLVDANLLKDYDLVISVGKTLFYAIAMGVPCYSYDETSTVGYITAENYDSNLRDNFASPQGYAPLTPEAIADDILRNYKKAISDSPTLRERAAADFHLSSLMRRFLKEIESRPEMVKGEIQKKYPLSANLSKVYADNVAFYRKDISRWYNESIKLGKLLDEAKADWLSDVNALSKKLSDIESSKTWILVNKLKAPLYAIRSFMQKRNLGK